MDMLYTVKLSLEDLGPLGQRWRNDESSISLPFSAWPALVYGGGHRHKVHYLVSSSHLIMAESVYFQKNHLRNARVGEPHDNNSLRQWGLFKYSCEHLSKAALHE